MPTVAEVRELYHQEVEGFPEIPRWGSFDRILIGVLLTEIDRLTMEEKIIPPVPHTSMPERMRVVESKLLALEKHLEVPLDPAAQVTVDSLDRRLFALEVRMDILEHRIDRLNHPNRSD
jgi:hypothetical protein